MNRKPKIFRLIYESGAAVGYADPRTGIAFYHLNWAALKAALVYLAQRAQEPVTIINCKSGDFLTVTPEGEWK